MKVSNYCDLLARGKRVAVFVVVLSDAEQGYNAVLTELRTAVSESDPRDEGATYKLQRLCDELHAAADRASRANPPVHIEVGDEVAAVLNEKAWALRGKRMVSMVSGISVGAWTGVFEWEMRHAIQFKYRLAEDEGWREGFAFAEKTDGKWTVSTREPTWLGERKRQHRVNDAQVDVIHDILNELGVRGD